MTPEQRALEKAVRKERPGLLSGLPGDKKRQLLEVLQARSNQGGPSEVMVHQSQITSSPVPPAELLRGYSDAFENGAERLFKLVEDQSAHRQSIETKVVDSQLSMTKRGQTMAFSIAVLFGGIGLYLGAIGERCLAGGIFTTTIAALVGIFIAGQKKQERSLDKKLPK